MNATILGMLYLHIAFLCGSAYAGGSWRLAEVARNPDGTILRVTPREAEKYCSDRGQRLFTIREFAFWSDVRNGFVGLESNSIRDTNYPGTPIEVEWVESEIYKMENRMYHTILTTKLNGKVTVDFYFKYAGPPIDWKDSEKWCTVSSSHTGHRDFVYTYCEYSNLIGEERREATRDVYAVRCTSKPE